MNRISIKDLKKKNETVNMKLYKLIHAPYFISVHPDNEGGYVVSYQDIRHLGVYPICSGNLRKCYTFLQGIEGCIDMICSH